MDSFGNGRKISTDYRELRIRALHYSYADMNLQMQDDRQVYAAIFDIPKESILVGGHTYTLVLFFGLNTHLYCGNGDAIVDLEKNQGVMMAMQSLLISSQQVLESMRMTSDVEYYESDNVRAYLKTRNGTYFAELDSEKREHRFLHMLLGAVMREVANVLEHQ